MTAIFIASLIAGLLLAVRAMLYGVERRAPDPMTGAPGRVGTTLAGGATAAIVFGIAGYLLARPDRLGTVWGTAIAAGFAVVAWAGAALLVGRAKAFVPEHDPDDPRYWLQGHVARVISRIDGEQPGEIAYEVDGRRFVSSAVAIDGSVAEVGGEVVIERLENGVAFVEPWATIEERL